MLQRKDMPMSNAQTDAKLGNQRRSCRPLGHLHVLRAQNERGNCAKLSLTRRTEPHMLDQTRRLVFPRLCGTISSGWKGGRGRPKPEARRRSLTDGAAVVERRLLGR